MVSVFRSWKLKTQFIEFKVLKIDMESDVLKILLSRIKDEHYYSL